MRTSVIMKKVNDKERSEMMIYFDNSATTAIDPQALDAYVKTSQRIIGNPSSLHALGDQATRLLRQARQQIAELLGVEAQEIVFTSGGTEGDNWVLKGTAIEKRAFGRHLIVSAIEHPAISSTVQQLADLGFEFDYAPVDEHGFVDVEALAKLIRQDTVLVSVMAVNNEIGTIQPIKEISAVLEAYPSIHFHVDAVQAIGKIPTAEFLTERVDFATFSAHKFHGPRGVGFIYWKSGKRLAPLITGGGQEGNRRSGTENVPAIVSMAKALRLLMRDASFKQEHERHLKQALWEALSQYEKVTIFSSDDPAKSAPHILCFGIKGVRGEVVVHAFEQHQIFISTTSACSSRKNMPAGTLKAMHVPTDVAETAVRISLDDTNTMAEVEQFMIIFNQLYQQFKKINS